MSTVFAGDCSLNMNSPTPANSWPTPENKTSNIIKNRYSGFPLLVRWGNPTPEATNLPNFPTPPRNLPNQIVIFPSPKIHSSPLNNNFHVITL